MRFVRSAKVDRDCARDVQRVARLCFQQRRYVREDVRQSLERVPISIAEKIKQGARSFTEAGGIEAYFGDPRAASREEGKATYEVLSNMIVTAVMEALEVGAADRSV